MFSIHGNAVSYSIVSCTLQPHSGPGVMMWYRQVGANTRTDKYLFIVLQFKHWPTNEEFKPSTCTSDSQFSDYSISSRIKNP